MNQDEVNEVHTHTIELRNRAALLRAESHRLVVEANTERSFLLKEKQVAIRKIREMYREIF